MLDYLQATGAYNLVYRNPTPATITRQFEEVKKIKNTFTFSFKESLSVALSVKISAAPVPLVTNFEKTISSTVGFEANQQKTVEDETQLKFRLKIKIPANACIEIMATL